MIRVHDMLHKGWESDNVVIDFYIFFIESDDDLPSDAIFNERDGITYKIAMGSLAIDLASSDTYMMNSSGEWVKQ